ncbi:hypothetical protein M1N18_00080 [Dehalococcoidales bacterium]|nr:hypothetical protein [Dehalococcoidales bacterium]
MVREIIVSPPSQGMAQVRLVDYKVRNLYYRSWLALADSLEYWLIKQMASRDKNSRCVENPNGSNQ